jgi:hypothetical protein
MGLRAGMIKQPAGEGSFALRASKIRKIMPIDDAAGSAGVTRCSRPMTRP